MKVLRTNLIYDEQVPCSDGTYLNIYELNVTVQLKKEEFYLFFSIDEGSSSWGHSFLIDSLGNERPGLLSPQQFQTIFSDPKVTNLVKQVEEKMGRKSTLVSFPEEQFTSYDYVAFYNFCKSIARDLRVKSNIITYDEQGICSYQAVKLTLSDGPIYILCNQYNVAFTKELDGSYPINFVDFPMLTSYFSLPYKICSVEELNRPFEITRPLSEWEQYSINYWKPQTQGDFLFNYWD
ncbi:hypothetical protein [Sutcliffiella sp. NC1]|uniref:hypothetical protein n=1 Tax=Sutcliffiella sp. NC1 TaxID=3004096 RepID=UPI0022DE5DF9|nr:hypothetical protein [Sutcliffiella sp. NC1]WBL16626.1 hypothetical protein O1A01_08340 [Sutcliffiella sp. NC1]